MLSNILETIGRSPVVRINRMNPNPAVTLAVKLEGVNPGGSVKDRIANPDNARAHYESTAVELWQDTEGEVDTLVAGIGTTGTLMGVSKRLRELKPEIKIVGVEPLPGHKIQGLKNLTESKTPEIFDPAQLDETVHVEDDLAFDTAIRLAREEGIFAGISSGAVMAGTIEVSRRILKGFVVALLPDRGEKYLSSERFCQYCEKPYSLE